MGKNVIFLVKILSPKNRSGFQMIVIPLRKPDLEKNLSPYMFPKRNDDHLKPLLFLGDSILT